MGYDWPTKPLRWISNRTLYVSVPFTWNLPQLRVDLQAADFDYDRVVVGGPAVNLMPDYFADMRHVTTGKHYPGVLQKVNPLATRTTIGCIRRCSFCAVPITEGALVELEDWPDLPVICDNNLLATSQRHFDRVCDRLEKWRGVDFNQGLDARLLTEYHAERLARIKGAIVRLALDHTRSVDQWRGSFETLRRKKVAKSRIKTYILCGYGSDPADAWARCRLVEKETHGGALPMWYHPLDAEEYGAVLDCHKKAGWCKRSKDRIMHYYYQHRGTPM